MLPVDCPENRFGKDDGENAERESIEKGIMYDWT